MASLVGKKTVAAPFNNAADQVRVVYDFAVDGGAVASFDVLVAQGNMVVKLKHMSVKTAVTSGGSMTMHLGKGSAGTDFLNAKAVATLTLDSIHVTSAPAAVKLAAAEKICMNINVAAATAGKVEMVFEVVRY